jgi:fructose-1,6-bisphosphatase/inositol monophosphatase family enzyme
MGVVSDMLERPVIIGDFGGSRIARIPLQVKKVCKPYTSRMDLIGRVTNILQSIVSEEVTPRFRQLEPGDIQSKKTVEDPDDIVTIVDQRVETRLVRELAGLVRGAHFVGEEAACKTPALLELLRGPDPVWVIDPIDGTKNFAHGDDRFGTMLALVQGGETNAGWIMLPAKSDLLVAERGSGSFLNGVRVHPHRREPQRRLRGKILSKYLPPNDSARIDGALRERFDPFPGSGCAAIEYMSIATGAGDFMICYRVLPWDHAPGALILREAGGFVEHEDGRPYTPTSVDQVTLLVADEDVKIRLRRWLSETGMRATHSGGNLC